MTLPNVCDRAFLQNFNIFIGIFLGTTYFNGLSDPIISLISLLSVGFSKMEFILKHGGK